MTSSHRRPLTEERRHRATLRFVILQCVVLVTVTVIAWLRSDADVAGFPVAGLLFAWGASSWLVLTFGWIGLYTSPSTTWCVIGAASVAAFGSGMFFYGVGIITTPILLLAGAFGRAVVVVIQQWLGIEFVAATSSPSTATA